jgi:hypothetical protein
MTKRLTPSAQDIDSVVEPVLVLSSKYLETEQASIPEYFWPKSGKYGIRGTSTYSLSSISNGVRIFYVTKSSVQYVLNTDTTDTSNST